jgi:hypothetical protein
MITIQATFWGTVKKARLYRQTEIDIQEIQSVKRETGTNQEFVILLRMWWPKAFRFKHTRVYPEVSGLAFWSEYCKCYNSPPLSAVVSLFYESV